MKGYSVEHLQLRRRWYWQLGGLYLVFSLVLGWAMMQRALVAEIVVTPIFSLGFILNVAWFHWRLAKLGPRPAVPRGPLRG